MAENNDRLTTLQKDMRRLREELVELRDLAIPQTTGAPDDVPVDSEPIAGVAVIGDLDAAEAGQRESDSKWQYRLTRTATFRQIFAWTVNNTPVIEVKDVVVTLRTGSKTLQVGGDVNVPPVAPQFTWWGSDTRDVRVHGWMKPNSCPQRAGDGKECLSRPGFNRHPPRVGAGRVLTRTAPLF